MSFPTFPFWSNESMLVQSNRAPSVARPPKLTRGRMVAVAVVLNSPEPLSMWKMRTFNYSIFLRRRHHREPRQCP